MRRGDVVRLIAAAREVSDHWNAGRTFGSPSGLMGNLDQALMLVEEPIFEVQRANEWRNLGFVLNLGRHSFCLYRQAPGVWRFNRFLRY